MNDTDEALYKAIRETEQIRGATQRQKSKPQVRGAERDSIRAVALRWFDSHRPMIEQVFDDSLLLPIDKEFQTIISISHKNAARSTYRTCLTRAGAALVELRSANAVQLAAFGQTPDNPPDFAKLISNPDMQLILNRRWAECAACLRAGAPLAAIVMVGGLLEGLLLARINNDPNKSAIFRATSAPKDKAGNPRQLKDWTLQDYIGVAHELKWITVAAKDVGHVLRDYRNFIHPQKELSHGLILTIDDAVILWEISKAITRQLTQ